MSFTGDMRKRGVRVEARSLEAVRDEKSAPSQDRSRWGIRGDTAAALGGRRGLGTGDLILATKTPSWTWGTRFHLPLPSTRPRRKSTGCRSAERGSF